MAPVLGWRPSSIWTDYILSQTGEGWSAVKSHYDDGGYSGGSMERPGLKQLMADIAQGLVDIVVVYKVDRLTRSLADFAKIVEQFDARGVSFVSVTQAFNTTSSMGRLTLNVLLSFAQFEREVTGERIRDKVAASKAKGLRMGGRPPLGYDIVEGRLAVNAREAETVRHIFRRYLGVESINALESALREDGVMSKRWINNAGHEVGGGALQRGALYYLLANPGYRGVTRHKDKRYENTHPAVVEADLWEEVQAKLAQGNAHQPETEMRGEGALLEGRLFDDRGHPMVVVHTTKGAKRYRYYLSRAKISGKGQAGSLHRIAAGMIEQHVTERLAPLLTPGWNADESPDQRIRKVLERVTLGEDQLVLQVLAQALIPDVVEAADTVRTGDGACSLRFTFQMHRRRGMEFVGSGPREQAARVDRALVRAMVLAQGWARQLRAVRSSRSGVSRSRTGSATTTLPASCRWPIWRRISQRRSLRGVRLRRSRWPYLPISHCR